MENKLKSTLNVLLSEENKDKYLMSEGTLVHEYLNWLSEYIDINAYQEYQEEENAPFLSIVTRTQGRRPEALQETLLCLAGQSDMDFELMIIGHKLNEEQEKLVLDIIDNQEEELRSRIRFIKVDNGTRTTPLNIGFASAKGKYISVLDDDDIVLDNWIEGFKRAYEEKPGAILHAYTLSQEWKTIDRGIDALRAIAAPTNEYCVEFDFLEELKLNYCPPVGLAFPRYAFSACGIQFDESLNTTEDWDLTMRMAFLCGVSDVKVPTCIYRLWSNTETSRTLHGIEEWQKNYNLIQDKFKQVPIVLSAGYSEKVCKLIEYAENSSHSQEYRDRFLNAALYVDFGNGFNEQDTMHEPNKMNGGKFWFEYYFEDDEQVIKSFRWDPDEISNLYLTNVSIEVHYKDKTRCSYTVSECYTNGYVYDESVLFIKDDPMLWFAVNNRKKVSKLVIKGNYDNDCPPSFLNRIFGNMDILSEKSDLYLLTGDLYSEEDKQSVGYSIQRGSISIEFKDLYSFGKVSRLRWDPCDVGIKTIFLEKIEIEYADGITKTIQTENQQCNGIYNNGVYAFIKDDPFIEFSIDNKVLEKVSIKFRCINSVSEDLLQQYFQKDKKKKTFFGLNRK